MLRQLRLELLAVLKRFELCDAMPRPSHANRPARPLLHLRLGQSSCSSSDEMAWESQSCLKDAAFLEDPFGFTCDNVRGATSLLIRGFVTRIIRRRKATFSWGGGPLKSEAFSEF